MKVRANPSRRGAPLIALPFALAFPFAFALAGCGTSDRSNPTLEAGNSLGAVTVDLYEQPYGYTWWDAHVESAARGNGRITVTGPSLEAVGGGCGADGWGACDALLVGGRLEIHLPDMIAAGHPLETFGLERVGSALQLEDDAGAVLLSLQPSLAGGVTIAGRTGALIASATRTDRGIQILNWDGAFVGHVNGNVPPEIAALALGGAIDTGGSPHIPDHAVVIAGALTWLK